jgi:uncharacterized membrane protein
MRRGRVYYAKLAGGRSMFVAPRLISHFAAIWMRRRKNEPQTLSDPAQRVLKVLRREHELATADLRAESGITERAAFTRALDELQRQMKVIPQDVIYQPFSYIWMLAEERFAEELRKRVARKTALREIARAYLAGAGMTLLGETARASGLSRVEAGSGNHQLVAEGYAIRLRQGVYPPYVCSSWAKLARPLRDANIDKFMTLLVLILILIGPYLILSLAGKSNPRFRIMPAKRARVGLSLFFIFTAIGHFIRTEQMAAMLPSSVPYRTELIYFTGVLELLGAIGVWIPGLTRLTGLLLILMLIGILPSNIYSAINRVDFGGHGAGPAYLLVRIPFQLFVIWWTYFATEQKWLQRKASALVHTRGGDS